MNAPGTWAELFQIARRCDNGEGVDADERRHALRSAMSLGCVTVPQTLACSVSQDEGAGRFVTTVSSDGTLATALDEVQYQVGDGPCLSAARHQRAEQINAMIDDERWAQLSRQAVSRGVHSSLSLPLPIRAPVGALNFYGAVVDAYVPARTQALASLLARTVSILLTNGPGRLEDLSSTTIQELMLTRSLIDRAQGMIMERDDIDATTAYHRLAVRSARQASSLADVARQVLTKDTSTIDNRDVSA
jgi:hypothetical protein